MHKSDVLVIGAGPFGLSVAAHLEAAGVDRVVVGDTLAMWRDSMPREMLLKSEAYGSSIAAPNPGFSLADYHRIHGLTYHERSVPLSRERFVEYGEWWARQVVPDVSSERVEELVRTDDGFRVRFAGGSRLVAANVVVATGLLPLATIPPPLRSLPAGLVSHSSDHADLSAFGGERVAVIGAGQSALQTAALLHEHGAQPTLISRRPGLNWLVPNPERITGLGHLKRPRSALGEGWHCWAYDRPWIWRQVPESLRVRKAGTILGPAGAWWLRPRYEGRVDTLLGSVVSTATPFGGGVHLQVDGMQPTTLDVDHVIAGTGFSGSLDKLPFLEASLAGAVRRAGRAPALSSSFESSVPGLYFVGALAITSLGPTMRFLSGTRHAGPRVARSIARSTRGGTRTTAQRPSRHQSLGV